MTEISNSDLEDLQRKNKLCFLEQEQEKIVSTLKTLSNEISNLEEGKSSLTLLSSFLHRYQEVLEGSCKAGKDAPWLPLADMLLTLLQRFSRDFEYDIQEVAAANVIVTFLAKAKELGFDEPSKSK